MKQEIKKLSLAAFVLMMLTSVFGVTNIGIGFYRMGYAAIPMFIIGGIVFFIPFLLMMLEFGTGFRKSDGGIYTWMKESVSPRFAFYGIFMWYSAYVIWMFGKALNMWTPLSVALHGKDITATMDPMTLSLLGVGIVILISFLITKGPEKFAKVASIGGLSVIALNVILIFGGIIAFGVNGFELQETFTMNSLVVSPNSDYNSIIPFLGFFVFAVFAFGGTEALAGISDDLKNPDRDLRRGIAISGIFIISAYVIGFIMVGAIMSWSAFPSENVNSLNALYIIMQNLGITFGGTGQLLMRFSGLGMFLSFFGAFITLAYSPLKQLIEATPSEFWPKSFAKSNKNGIRTSAVKMQAIIVSLFLIAKGVGSILNPEGANKLFELIISMTNVALTLPYLFLIFAWYKYRKNDNLEKGLVLIKGNTTVTIAAILAFVAVLFGNVFTIIDPFLSGDISTGVWTIIGPILFTIIATIIYNRGFNKIKKNR